MSKGNAKSYGVVKKSEITPEDIAEVISLWTGIPVASLTEEEARGS